MRDGSVGSSTGLAAERLTLTSGSDNLAEERIPGFTTAASGYRFTDKNEQNRRIGLNVYRLGGRRGAARDGT